MSAPIRSASLSPFAAARPLVHSRRVSLRVGSFGLTYSTDKVLWNSDPPPVDPAPPVESERPESQPETSTFPLDLEAARKQSLWATAQERAARHENPDTPGSVPQAVVRQAIRPDPAGRPPSGIQVEGPQIESLQGERRQAERRQAQGQQGVGQQGDGQGRVSRATGLESMLAGQTKPSPVVDADGIRSDSAGLHACPSGRKTTLAQAMRQAAQAYLACANNYASARPMLQAVA